jgi:hypothetical protein
MDNFATADAEQIYLAQYKLARLRELRAVIDSLQQEREPFDPLLNWIVERDAAENH